MNPGRRGILLVEAAISAVVIGVGLVLVSRGLATQLRAVERLEAYETLTALADTRLRSLEAERLFGIEAPTQAAEGIFEAPHEAYHWRLHAVPRDHLGTAPEISEVTLRVWSTGPGSPEMSLRALWPRTWVPEAWY